MASADLSTVGTTPATPPYGCVRNARRGAHAAIGSMVCLPIDDHWASLLVSS
jgi:hypothetical protein